MGREAMPPLRRKLYLGLSVAVLALPGAGLAAAVGAGKVSLPAVSGFASDAMIRPFTSAPAPRPQKTLAPSAVKVPTSSPRQTLAAPTSLTVTSTAQTSVTLSWQKARSLVSGYKVYLNSVLKATTTATSYKFVTLTCGTSYTLGVAAVDKFGNLSARRSVVATTSPCAASTSSPPTAPGPLTVTGTTTTSVSVSWAPSTGSGGVVGYGAYLDGAVVGAPTSTSFTFSGLQCGTTHLVAIDAVDAAGQRSAQTSASVPTAACPDPTPPAQPGNLSVTGASTTTIGVTWTASSDNVGVTGYDAYSNGRLWDTVSTPGYTFAGLTCGTSYTLSVDAYDAAGNVSPKATVTASTSPCADTSAPSMPGSIHVTASTATTITVAWTASTDNVGVVAYDMFTNGTGTGATTYASATQGSMTCGTSYTIGVDAADAAGNKSARASVTASTAACAAGDTSPPSLPGSLHVTGSTATTIALAWTASTDNVGVVGYDMFTNGTGTGTTAYTSVTQGSMTCGTSYTIGVDAYDAAGNKSGRASVSASTSACAPAPPPPPPPPPPSVLGCFADPYARCGLPDPTHAGVPAGTVLTPSGNITVSTPGTVINALDVTGKIQVNANNVTIQNTRVTQTGGSGVTGGIGIAKGVTGTKLSYDEIRGAGPIESQAAEQVVSSMATGTTGDHLYLHNCAECWHGQGDLTYSLIAADGTVTGAHYEDFYIGDPAVPGAGITCDHCTLLNPHDQTAILFTDTSREPGSHGTVSNSLIVGGGWSFYTAVNLTNVRMARCLTSSVSAPNGGHACSGGQDSNGYWPGGGYFGVNPNCSAKNATWTNVVWDDNSQPVGC